MAKLKMMKLPKKPKASASVAVKQAFLHKVAEVKRENQRRHSENMKSEALAKQISKISAASVRPGARSVHTGGKRRKKSTAKKSRSKKRK